LRPDGRSGQPEPLLRLNIEAPNDTTMTVLRDEVLNLLP
jgi:hypothetical protein